MRRRHQPDEATARRIAEARRAAGLTQNELALELGYSESVVSRWETMRAPVPPDTLARVEQILSGTRARALV